VGGQANPAYGLVQSGLSNTVSARMFGNVVLVDAMHVKQQHNDIRGWITAAASAGNWDILESRLIDASVVAELGRVLINRAFVWELEASPPSAVLQT
jgi:hypothetical protein